MMSATTTMTTGGDEAAEGEVTKIRISLILSPSYYHHNNRDSLQLPNEPIAVPATIRKRGLSAVVNHLLGRRVPTDNDDDRDNNNEEEEEENDKLSAIPFDFLINDKLLRLPLDSTVRKEGLSTEHAVIVHYFPARLPPRKGGETETLPDWITAMDYASINSANTGMLVVGGADGIVRAYSSSTTGPTTSGDSSSSNRSLNKIVCSASAHAGSIQCLSVSSLIQNNNNKDDCNGNGGDGVLVATGSMDQTLVTHILRENTLNLHAVYSGGHANSISSVALALNGQMMASGDWDGGISLWSVPSSSSSSSSSGIVADDNNDEDDKPKKKRKGSSATMMTTGNDVDGMIHEVKPLTSVKAHSSNVAGLIWGHHDGNSSPTTLLSGSWDHGLKVYDTARMDCVLTLNGSRVVSAMDRCSNGNVVATGSPDCIVRLWDMRTNNNGSSVSNHIGGMDKSLRQSHKSWVSSVKWSPTDPFILASTSHDGTMKIWDIRSYLPLHTVNAVNNKKLGEKALCLAFGNGVIYSGGSDCVVKQFSCNV